MLRRVDGSNSPLAALVEAARAGDRAAYAELYERFRGAVHGVILARVSRADAQDLVQDTFVAGWARLDDLREAAAFPGWFLEIARRRAIDHARRTKRPPAELDDEAAARASVEPTHRRFDPEHSAEAKQALALLRTLPDAYRETLILRLVEGMSGPEIAAVTGMKPESVRVNLCRGMKLLKEKLGGEP
ncbi:MAG: sigma-70 family RNA polymerase sigma factor [Polyangiaceae bacterium]|nr:sigma-70 family RNA polymerase sigma factor [Polyangiaceae bacterium]